MFAGHINSVSYNCGRLPKTHAEIVRIVSVMFAPDGFAGVVDLDQHAVDGPDSEMEQSAAQDVPVGYGLHIVALPGIVQGGTPFKIAVRIGFNDQYPLDQAALVGGIPHAEVSAVVGKDHLL